MLHFDEMMMMSALY